MKVITPLINIFFIITSYSLVATRNTQTDTNFLNLDRAIDIQNYTLYYDEKNLFSPIDIKLHNRQTYSEFKPLVSILNEILQKYEGFLDIKAEIINYVNVASIIQQKIYEDKPTQTLLIEHDQQTDDHGNALIQESFSPINPKKLLFLGIMRIICKNSLLQQPLYKTQLPYKIKSNHTHNHSDDNKMTTILTASSQKISVKHRNDINTGNQFVPYSNSFITENTNHGSVSDYEAFTENDIKSLLSPVYEIHPEENSSNNNANLYKEKSVQTDDFFNEFNKNYLNIPSNRTAVENFVYKINGDFCLSEESARPERFNHWKNILPDEIFSEAKKQIVGKKEEIKSKNMNISSLSDIMTNKPAPLYINKTLYPKSKSDEEKFSRVNKHSIYPINQPSNTIIYHEEPRKILRLNTLSSDARGKFRKEGSLYIMIKSL